MKAVAIKNETKHVAHMAENNKEFYLLPLFHEMLMCPKKSTKAIVADVATILYSFENPSNIYYKYTN